MIADPNTATDPERDCPRCPRLVEFREKWRAAHPQWHNAPVATFSAAEPRLLILGLAPGIRGANATGRPFTGDYAGDLLYATLKKFGFASGDYQARVDDGLTLIDTAITNAVRCVPPDNKPVGAEINACRPFLQNTLHADRSIQIVMALGRIAHETFLRMMGLRLAAYPFSHGAIHNLPQWQSRSFTLVDSYHCSRYNTNTRRLTPEMFEAVFQDIRDLVDRGS
uniref:uracil-DNA glycosylase n=1 Tax=Pararhizobium sp. IMCC3301 TaxID=3067904 RepID=UPI002741D42E|nr:uracil-DNA glycosylase [Pararhizobium sp. IMCC3301]